MDILWVGEVNGSVKTNSNNAMWKSSVRILQNVSVHFCPRDISQASGVGSSDVEKDFDEGDADSNKKTDLYRDEENAKESTQSSQEVELVNLPYKPCCFEVDQRDDSGDDDGGEDGIWGVLE